MTQTQEIITHRVLKIHEWIQGNVYEWGKVSQGMTSEKFLTLEQQNKGPGMSRGQSYTMPMMSHDIIGMIEGVGWVWEGGVGMKNTQVYQFSPNPSQMCVKIFYVISYLIFGQINLIQCTLNYEISIILNVLQHGLPDKMRQKCIFI